jgi:FkbM family methyltransferase
MSDIISNLQRLSKRFPLLKPVSNLANRYWNIRHHRSAISFYSQFIKKGNYCFDVGANLGNRTRLFLELGATVVSVEPQEACLKHLHELFGANSKVRIIPKALSDKEGTATLAICEESPILSTMSGKWQHEGRFSKEFRWSSSQEVPTTTLDALITEFGRPSFCKIDVEGFEETVLKGLSQPIPVISFEFTVEFLNDAAKCINLLTALGEVKFNFSLGEKMKLYHKKWVTPSELITTLESMNDIKIWGDIYARFNR